MKLVCCQPLAIKNGWRQIMIDKMVPTKGNTMNEMLQTNLPTRRQLHAELDRMTLSADAKVLMGTLLETTAEVAGRIIEVGRQILAFAIDMLKRFPNTGLGLVVGLTLTAVIGAIPFLGAVLAPLVGPLLTAFTVTNGALADMKNSSLEKQIDLFSAKLDEVIANA